MSTTATGTTAVLVVDDHTIFSDLLAMALDNEPDFDCVGTAASVEKALVMADELRPDLVLMDVQLGDGDGVAATAELTRTYPELRVVVMTAHTSTALMQRAAGAGACALLPKDGSLRDMLEALRSSRRGVFVLHPSLLTGMVTRRPRRRSDSLPTLTRRERDVLRMLAGGSDARGIAKGLGISINTCRSYLRGLLLKLGAHSQLEAVVIAMAHGLVWVASDAVPGGVDRRDAVVARADAQRTL
jgi:DNA-binding NarL/FixJ family response regulator